MKQPVSAKPAVTASTRVPSSSAPQPSFATLLKGTPQLDDIDPRVLLRVWDAAGGDADVMLEQLVAEGHLSADSGMFARPVFLTIFSDECDLALVHYNILFRR